jgi:iron-sulfur cluster assembly protein
MMNKPSVQRDNSGVLTIKISSDAVNHIRSFGNLEGKNKTNLRVAVKGGGCSGLTYVLELAENPSDNEKVISENGMELYVDKKSYIFLAGTTLEYQGGLNGKGFVFQNPNAKTTCGCGTSFSV